MPSLEELQAWANRKPRNPEKIIERKIIHGVAVAMSEIKGDPNWKIFCDHIESLRQQAEAMTKRLERELLDGMITADYSHYELKRQLAIFKTRFETYTQCVEIIDVLINRGKHENRSTDDAKG